MKKCLVLGANGFVGRSLTTDLANIFEKVVTFSLDISNEITSNNVVNIVGNFFEQDSLENAVRGCDVVIHLITTMNPVTSNLNPIQDIEQNLIGTVRLLEVCRKQEVKKVIFLSSGGTVYGDLDSVEKANELHMTNPSCSYGIVKLAIEKYLHLYQQMYGINPIVLRVSNPYGPLQECKHSQGVIASFVDKAVKNEGLEIWGDGTNVRDYIYIDDLVSAIKKSIFYQGDKTVFNISSGLGESLNEIVDNMSTIMNKKIDVIYLKDKYSGVHRSVLDNSLAISELQWQPVYTLVTGLEKTIKHKMMENC
ncbi:MAG: NAD-dependent epimerase/dehydratase family protein [Vibrio ordalii]|uniref:NAD-dependent epimerase/dehydratase family protein n=1 Tax=Vibrio ordalii TaxID=28174 RepID=UPI003F364CB7